MSNFGAAQDLTQSDSSVDSFNWLMVTTTGGSVIIDQVGGNQTTLSAVPVGAWVPVGNAIRVRTASTAVGIMVS